MSKRNATIRELFEKIVEIPSTKDQSEFLDQHCAGDSELRREVEALVKAHISAGSFLGSEKLKNQSSLTGTTQDTQPQSSNQTVFRRGAFISNYKLLQQIGAGGMGAVWMAEQEEPVRRRVALKLILGDIGNPDTISRFEAERQALAIMEHPNIARVFDAGTTLDGIPWFVMELVKGFPITKYCDENKLGIRERLELMVLVCRAVQHAHHKGIVHRDLKPSNVLVTLYDGQPVPKIIDFGLAKALAHQTKLTDKTLFTEFGKVVGTLQYMSPEQAELNTLDVDTRTDVYSLGVLLYELLTGSTPIEKTIIGEKAVLQILAMIRDTEPPRPSTRLSDSGDAVTGISEQRKIAPNKLGEILRGELDWIVMKALEKDRARRFETANDFASDLERYLNDETVAARPPSFGYKLKKFVRKNRRAVVAVAASALALIGGIAGTSYGLVQAKQSEKEAIASAKEERKAKETAVQEKEKARVASIAANTAKQQAEANANAARKSAKRSADALKVFTSAFRSSDPFAGAKPEMTAKEVLENANELTENSDLDAEGKAELFQSLSTAFVGLGDFKLAVSTGEQAVELRKLTLGSDNPKTTKSMGTLAFCYEVFGEYKKAIELNEVLVAASKRKFGLDNVDTLGHMANLANSYYAAGNISESIKLHEQVLKKRKSLLGHDHRHTIHSMGGLANSYHRIGKIDKAIELEERSVQALEKLLKPDHPDLLTSLSNLASRYRSAGRIHEAIKLDEKTLESKTRVLGPDHPDTLLAMNGLAGSYQSDGRFQKAIELQRKARSISERTLGVNHPATLSCIHNLANSYQAIGENTKAITLLKKVLNTRRRILGPDHPDTLTSMFNLGATLGKIDDYEQSIPLLVEALEKQQSKLGPEHPSTQINIALLGVSYLKIGDAEKAIPMLEKAAFAKHENLKSKELRYLKLAGLRQKLRKAYLETEKYEKFKHSVDEELKLAGECRQTDSFQLAFALILLQTAHDCIDIEDFELAESLLSEAHRIQLEKAPDKWQTFCTQSALGEALFGQFMAQENDRNDGLSDSERKKQFAKIRELLARGYEGMKKRAEAIPTKWRNVRLIEALDRLIKFKQHIGGDPGYWQKEREQWKD